MVCVWQTEEGWDTGVSVTPAMKVSSGTWIDFMVLYLFMKMGHVILLIELFGDLISYEPFIALGERDMEMECMTKLYWIKTDYV